ncbi:MAG: TRAP transporter small permease [Cyclobacteriaceae bacterium]
MKYILKIAKIGVLLSMVGMIGAVLIQVYSRFFLDSAPNWTEEGARIFFVYVVAFGAGLGIQNGSFVRLELMGSKLPEKLQASLELFIQISVLIFMAVMTWQSCLFVQIGHAETSPTLDMPMSLVFFSMVLLMASMAVFTLPKIYSLYQKIKLLLP